MLALIFELVFPFQVAAASVSSDTSVLTEAIITSVDADNQSEANMTIFLAVPRREYLVVKTMDIPVTAYSSTTDQTDGTPCITANGFDLCAHDQEDVIAANFLPFGSKVRMPELFADRVFTVQDRMNARYQYRADIWMKSRQAAIVFGLAYTRIEVIE